MRPVPARCPICSQAEITIARIECPQCASTIEGAFRLHRLNHLTPDQLFFIETFLLNEGKINRVEQEMGLSYAAVRGRLEEIIAALGGAPAAAEEGNNPPGAPGEGAAGRREDILAQVAAGEISAEEAATLIRGA